MICVEGGDSMILAMLRDRYDEDIRVLKAGEAWESVLVCCGKEALERRVGVDKVNEVRATRKYQGERATQRSGWEPYCFEMPEGELVSCLSPTALRKSRWKLLPRVAAALDHAVALASGCGIWQPPSPVKRIGAWQ